MDQASTIRYARNLLEHAGAEDPLAEANYLDFCEVVRAVVADLSPSELQDLPKFKDFSESFRRLRDDFEIEVRRDPMILYKPKHSVALAFHKSTAFIRNYHGGNRISKTESGKADNYWVLTGQHPYRPKPTLPAAVFIVGMDFSKYGPNVFYKKYIHGEPANPLSPAFPIGGKWFNRLDDKKHIVYLACPDCAIAGKAGACPHQKSTLTLFSDNEGPGVLAGGQYSQGQFDEQISPEFFSEAKQRLKTVPNSGLIITETPLYGKGWWTYTDVYLLGQQGPPENLIPGTNTQIVSNHSIDQFSAGLVPHELILADMQTMSDQQIQARIYGKYIAASDDAVFDLTVLAEMRKEIREPTKIRLSLDDKEHRESFLAAVRRNEPSPDNPLKLTATEDETSNLQVWEYPNEFDQYVVGADVATGMTNRDYSAASVLKLTREGTDISFEMVAMYRGWTNPIAYADELYKLASWYNCCQIVPENNGPGLTTIRRLRELWCWFLFREVTDLSQVATTLDPLLGVNTNIRTKSVLIGTLQDVIRQWRTGRKAFRMYSETAIEEFESFIQEQTQTGLNFRFKGMGRSNDDIVIATAMAVYATTFYPVYSTMKEQQNQLKQKKKERKLDDRTYRFWEELHIDLDREQQEEEELWE